MVEGKAGNMPPGSPSGSARPSGVAQVRKWSPKQVVQWVTTLGPIGEQHAAKFGEHEIDGHGLLELDKVDMRAMGIAKVGHGKFLLFKIAILGGEEKIENVRERAVILSEWSLSERGGSFYVNSVMDGKATQHPQPVTGVDRYRCTITMGTDHGKDKHVLMSALPQKMAQDYSPEQFEEDMSKLSKIPSIDFISKKRVYTKLLAELLEVDVMGERFTFIGHVHFFWKQADFLACPHVEMLPVPSNNDGVNFPIKIEDIRGADTLPVNPSNMFANVTGDPLEHLEEIQDSYNIETQIVHISYRFKVSVGEELELHRFPFDRQFLQILINGRTERWEFQARCPDDFIIDYKYRDTTFSVIPGPSVNAWELETPIVDFTQQEPGGLLMAIRVERRYAYYLSNIFLPLYLMVGLCAIAFEVDKNEIADRIGIVLTLILTTVAFKFLLAGELPQTAYMTLVDKYVLLNYIMMMMCAVEGVVAFKLSESAAYDLDMYSAIVYILVWTIGHIVFLLLAFQGYFHKDWDEVAEENMEEETEVARATDEDIKGPGGPKVEGENEPLNHNFQEGLEASVGETDAKDNFGSLEEEPEAMDLRQV